MSWEYKYAFRKMTPNEREAAAARYREVAGTMLSIEEAIALLCCTIDEAVTKELGKDALDTTLNWERDEIVRRFYRPVRDDEELSLIHI